MAKLTKSIKGVLPGDVYPTQLAAGEDCPPSLEAAARSLGALEEAPAKKTKAASKAPETK